MDCTAASILFQITSQADQAQHNSCSDVLAEIIHLEAANSAIHIAPCALADCICRLAAAARDDCLILQLHAFGMYS